MPYAPGITYRAGDYFAAAGPRINENIQQFMSNRRERQQMTTTAEMLARYIKDDPHAMEMFGPELAKIPGASLGAAKGIVGGLTSYLTQRHLTAVEKSDTERNRILDQRMEDQNRIASGQLDVEKGKAARTTAEDERLAQFNQAVGEGMQPQPGPPQVPYALGQQPDVIPQMDAQTLYRLGAKAGVIGHPQFTAMATALERYGGRTGQSLEPMERPTKGGRKMWSDKTGQFQYIPDMPFTEGGEVKAVSIVDEDGNVLNHGLPTPHGGVVPLALPKPVREITAGEQATIIKGKTNIQKLMQQQQLLIKSSPEGTPAGDAARAQMVALQKDLDALNALLEGAKKQPEKPGKKAATEYVNPPRLPDASLAAKKATPGMGDLRESQRAEDTRVEMIHPMDGSKDAGKRVGVRADQVEEALKQGFTRAK